jgi:crossover junction endodeoxyribonuclease RuvC
MTPKPFRILAIDPGYDRLGVAIVERQANQAKLVFSTCVESSRHETFSERLGFLGRALTELCLAYTPSHLAIETLFFNKNVKTALLVAQARGMILYVARQHDLTICEYSPQQVKVATTGYGNSDKHAVYTMVKRLIPATPAGGRDDEYDAIAVGITCLAHNGQGR